MVWARARLWVRSSDCRCSCCCCGVFPGNSLLNGNTGPTCRGLRGQRRAEGPGNAALDVGNRLRAGRVDDWRGVLVANRVLVCYTRCSG